MSNFFDQFDEKEAPPSNFFDQFDAPEGPKPGREPDSVRAYGASLKNLPASVKFLLESGFAKPVDALSGAFDSVAGAANLLNPINLTRAVGAASQGEGRQAVEALGDAYNFTPAGDASRALGIDGTTIQPFQDLADETRAAIQNNQRVAAENRPESFIGGLGLDVLSEGTQLGAAALAARLGAPSLGAGLIAGRAGGLNLADGVEQGLEPQEAFKRAFTQTGFEYITEKPVLEFLTKPLSKVSRSDFVGRLAARGAAEGGQEALAQVLSNLYDAAVLEDKNITVAGTLKEAGYGALVGSLVGTSVGAPATISEQRQGLLGRKGEPPSGGDGGLANDLDAAANTVDVGGVTLTRELDEDGEPMWVAPGVNQAFPTPEAFAEFQQGGPQIDPALQAAATDPVRPGEDALAAELRKTNAQIAIDNTKANAQTISPTPYQAPDRTVSPAPYAPPGQNTQAVELQRRDAEIRSLETQLADPGLKGRRRTMLQNRLNRLESATTEDLRAELARIDQESGNVREDQQDEEALRQGQAEEVAPEQSAPLSDDRGGPIVEPPPPVDTQSDQRDVAEVPLTALSLSDDVPQFKAGARNDGVVEPLGGSFDRRGVAPIQVWERKDGRMEVVSGRHRFDLAKRSGEQSIPAQVYREADGFSREQAATLDAELNIRDGQGSVADYVGYFRNAALTRKEAEDRGLLSRAKGKAGWRIADSGSPELIAALDNKAITDQAAEAVAINAPGNARLQTVALQSLMKGESIGRSVNLMRAVQAMSPEGQMSQQDDMFGMDDSAMVEAAKMARTADSIQRGLREQVSAVSGAARRPEQAAKLGVNVADPDGVRKRIDELRAEAAQWDNWMTDPSLVARVRQEAGLAPMTRPEVATEEEGGPPEPAAPEGPGLFDEAPSDGGFSLESQTEGSRRQSEARVAQAEAQKQKQRQQAEMRAQSERDAADFTLTGSDRPRDVGVPAGQAEMLVDEAPRAKAAPAADARLEDGPSVPDAKFKPGETVNARPGRTIDEAKVVRVFDREVAGMKTRVAVIERPDGKRLQVNEGELSAGRFGSPAAGETSGKQAQPAGARRPQPGESGYTLVDAMNDLMELRAQADRQGSVADDRLMSSIRQQEKLVKDMEAAAAKPSDYEKVIAKAESQIQVRSRQTGQTQWVTLRNDWTEGNRKDGSKVSVRSGGMVARVMEIDPADVVDWGSTSQGTGGKTSKKADLATRKVSENTVFTEDAAAKARELLRKKLGQINTGIDPEIMQAGITLAGYHIEKGARTFAAYAKAMVEDLGDSVKPYLKSWYMGVKFDPRAADLDGMSPSSEVEAANVDAAPTETQNAPAPEEPKRSGMDLDPGEQVIFDSFVAGLKRDGFANITQARAIYNQMRTEPESPSDQKRTEELMEMAIVTVAREIVDSTRSPEGKYEALVELYGKQPNLKTRTSTSIEQQAYSTPAPLAYLASQLAGINKGKKVLEPSAGNGMLLIGADPKNSVANELNRDRANNLRSLGFNPTVLDASTERLRHSGYPVDAVIANPPFGAVKDESGSSRRWDLEMPSGETLSTGEVDHAITFNALKSMRPDGKAVFIVGGVSRAVKGDEARADAYHKSAAKRNFYFHLYKNYNVTDHFTVAGELYGRQGAAWPVDVIVIDGAGVSSLPLPAVEAPQVYSDWASLKEKLNVADRVVPKQEARSSGVGSGPSGRADQQQRVPDGSGDAPVRSGESVRRPAGDGRVSRGSTSGRGALGRDGERDAGRRGDADSQQPADVGALGRDQADRPAAGQGSAAVDAGSRGRNEAGQSAPAGSSNRDLARAPAQVKASASQTPYSPTSKSNAIGTLVPTNMGRSVVESLRALESRVGGVDAFVAGELGYKESDIGRYFSAEQIDSLALALDSIKRGKGFIIGDQTGIGKGRVVAGVIRWAIRNGKTPIFVTEKPTLYSDMYRDLTDIGMQDIRPIMTNAAEKVPLDEAGTVLLKTDTAKVHGAMLQRMAEDGGIGDYNVVFTTYSQMQERGGQETPQRRFLSAAADGGVVIFDESHNAGGVAAGGRGKTDDIAKEGRAGFARAIAGAASGVFYSSATYAKRPDVMDLYFKTDMALAVDGDIRKLPTAIQSGGVPLQQVVATMLTKAGQYIRRERTFEGVEYQAKPVPVNRKAAEKISEMMRSVRTFDEAKKSAVESIKKEARAQAAVVSGSNAVGAAGAESANFTSVMHNLIDQMLLALKVESAANEAIAALKRGEKPVITLANTMGSFISEYAKENNLKPGDVLPLSFADMMTRYLEKSRMVYIKDAAGRRTPHRLTEEELGGAGRAAYRRASQIIASAGELGDIPVSPVDYLRHRLESAGYKTAEITGRSDAVDYSTPGAPVYRMRGSKERSISGRRNAIAGFNNGDVDMVILNQSGSTGISLHASEKFKKRQRRRMIIAQAEKNIDTHMQMLGRVHRTGQVIAPAYTQLVADIPAEKRPAAILAKKMASLNANTTANRDSDFTAKESVDFLNEYGDEVVAQMMEDMPEIHDAIGEPLKYDEKGLIREDAARKVTGRLPLLNVDEQERIYELIESGYKEAIERADAMGENTLEAKTLELDARKMGGGTLFEAKDASSPFSAGATLEVVSAKRLGKPLKSDQVIALAAKNMGIEADTIEAVQRAGQDAKDRLMAEMRNEMNDYTSRELAALAEMDAEAKTIRTRTEVLNGAMAQFSARMQAIKIGSSYAVQIPEQGTIYGVVVDIKRKKGVKLPVALGAWNVSIALADGARMLTVPLSKLGGGDGKVALMPASRDGSGESVMNLFDLGQTQSREERVIATGNLLAAYSRLGRGQITNFTREDGTLDQGIIMPKSFKLDAFINTQPVILEGEQVVRMLSEESNAIIKSANGDVEIRSLGNGRFSISVPSSKQSGGAYFLDRGLRGIVGDFSSYGKAMNVKLDQATLVQAVRYMESSIGQKFGTTAYRDTALSIGGKPAVQIDPTDPEISRMQSDTGPASNRPEAPEWERGQVDKLNGILARQAGQEVPLRAVEAPRAMRDLSQTMETLLGRKAVFFESSDPRAPAGVYVSGGVLFVNADAKQPLRHVLGHEFTHSLEGPAAELHAILKARVLEMAKAGAFPAYEARLEKVYQRDGLPKLSRAKVENEFVADVMGSIMSDPKVLFDLKQRMEPNAFKRLMNRLRFWIEKMMSRLRREDMRQSQFAQRTMRDLQSVKAMVADVLQATAEGQLRPAMRDAAMEGQPMFARDQNPPDGGFSDSGADVAFSRRGQTDPDDADGLMTETLGKETVGQKLYRNVLNRFSEVERAVKYLKGKGVAIPDERDPGSLEKTFYGRTQTRLDDLKDTTEALFKVMNKAGVDFKQASDYLYALHARERNAAIAERNSRFPDGGSGMTNRQAAKILADTAALPKAQRDALAEVSRVVQRINRQKLNLMREAGLISAQQYQDLTTGYQHYVPLKSVVDPEEEGQGTGNGFDQRSTVIREAFGRASRAEDPLAVALLDAQKTFVRAEKNRVGRAVYNLILETSGNEGLISGPAGDYWRVLTPEEYPKQARKVKVPVMDPKTGKPQLDAKGKPVTTEDVRYVPNMNDLYRRDEIFMARVDGNLVVMEFKNKQLAKQLKNMAGEQLTGVLRGMSMATKFFGRLLTQYNPEFAVPNFIRDVQTAYLNAFGADMENPKGFAGQVMKNLKAGLAGSIRGKNKGWILEGSPLYREFLEAGGATGAYGLTGVDDIKAEYEKLVAQQRKGISPGMVVRAGKGFIKKVERFNEIFENTTRLAIYKAARDRGLSKQEAARLAKDTTVNFNQKGEQQWPGALYVFFNAAMQGNIAMLKAAARSKVTQSAMAGLMIFGLMESLMEDDDDEGEPLGDAAGKWSLGREFTAFLDDNTFIKVPLAYGYNVPYAMGRMLGRAIRGNASPAEAVGTSLNAFMTSFVPTDSLVPTIAEPFLGVLKNETSFGSTIYRRSFGDASYDPIAYRDYEQKRLTGLMQMLHELAGGDRYQQNVVREVTGFDPFSASGAEALVKGYVGPQFRLAQGVAGLMAYGAKAVFGDLTVDDIPDLNEVPVTRRFVNERSEYFYDSRFSEIAREADAARKTIKNLQENREPVGDRYTPAQMRAINATRLANNQDRKLRKVIESTESESRKAELEARRDKLIRDAIRRYNDAFAQ